MDNMTLSNTIKTGKKSSALFLIFFLCLACFGIFTTEAPACTIAVVSGDVTPDGRPLLWKNRDKQSWIKNEVKFYTYPLSLTAGYVGIVDSDNDEDTKMWSGVNDDGFAICNSVILGLGSSNNGIFLKAALESCATVDEFQTFLTNWSTGGISGNFGVIDNLGGASMFQVYAQVGNVQSTRTDASSQTCGYVVMANYNVYGGGTTGHLRKVRAETILGATRTRTGISHEYIIRHVSKDMESVPANPGPTAQYDTEDNISRYRTRSATIVHGTLSPESPIYTTLWTVLGEPAFGPAVPIFSYAHSVPDEMSAPFNQMAPMNEVIEDRELLCYSDNTNDDTIMPYPLVPRIFSTSNDPPIQDYVFDIEDYTFDQTEDYIDWLKSIKRFKVPADFKVFQDETSESVYKCYLNEDFKKW